LVGVTAGLGVPSTLTWKGSSSTAPETPAGVATTAMAYATARAAISVQPVPSIRPGYPAISLGLPVNAQQQVPGSDAQLHDLPDHARRPSASAQPAIPSATTPSSHQAPSSVLAASPANTAWPPPNHNNLSIMIV
jgi:hypothetical protein